LVSVLLFGLFFFNILHGWASGEKGTIVHLKIGK